MRDWLQRQACRIPLILRVPLALASYGFLFFGPILLGFYFRGPLDAIVVMMLGLLWLTAGDRFLAWRIDTFWNVKSYQNRTPFPAHPDNHRTFKTFKGWMYWIFLGKDIEN